MEDKITTIEGLAAMIQRNMASKGDLQATREDFQEVRGEMKQEFTVVHSRLDSLDARMGRMEADVHELRGEIVYKREFEDALDRIKYIEKKLGIESGV